VPNSVQAITPLVGRIQIESEARRAKGEYVRVYVFHNRPKSGALYERSANACCRLTRNGKQVWPKFPGRRSCCPKSCAAAP